MCAGLNKVSEYELVRVENDRRISLPFKEIIMDKHFSLSNVVIGQLAFDGYVGFTPIIFKEPVHPAGYVNQLIINGHIISVFIKDTIAK